MSRFIVVRRGSCNALWPWVASQSSANIQTCVPPQKGDKASSPIHPPSPSKQLHHGIDRSTDLPGNRFVDCAYNRGSTTVWRPIGGYEPSAKLGLTWPLGRNYYMYIQTLRGLTLSICTNRKSVLRRVPYVVKQVSKVSHRAIPCGTQRICSALLGRYPISR